MPEVSRSRPSSNRPSTMNKKLAAVIEHDNHGYYAFCPELKGCHTQGDTFEEALANLREAVELYLETLSEEEKSTVFSRSVITTSLDMAHA